MKLYLYENLLSERYVIKETGNTKDKTYGQIFDKLDLDGSFLVVENDEVKEYPNCKEDVPVCDAIIHVKRIPKKDSTAFGYIFGALQVVAGAVLTCFGVGSVGVPLIISGAGAFATSAIGQIFKGPNVPDQKGVVSGVRGKEQYGLQGAKNHVLLGSKYPVIFGTHIITPPLVATYYTELSDNSGRGDMYLYGLLCIGYKELSVKNIQFGLNPIATNKKDVRNGFIDVDGNFKGQLEIKQDGTYPQLYEYKHYEEQVNAEIVGTDTSNMQTRFTPKKTTKITSIVQVSGLYKMNDKGELEHVSVIARMAYRKRGAGSWNYIETNLWFNTADILRFEITKEFSADELKANPDGDWEVGIYRTTNPSDDIKVKDKVYWSMLRSKINDRPVIESELSKLCLLAFKIKATETTNGVLDHLNCMASSVLPVYNGTNWNTYEVSSNPASAYLHCLRGNFLPQKADIETIDFEALEELYRWCDTNGYKCDGIISNGEPLRNILNKILATCCSSFYIKSGLYSLICDNKKSNPIALLTPKNSRDFTASKSFAKLPKALEITYNDANNNYTPKCDTVLLHGENIDTKAGDVTEKLSIWGVTDYNQIVKLGRYFLADARNRPELYNLTVSIEHFGLPVGERVLLQHDVLLIGLAGGFIKNVDHDKKTIKIDEVQVLDNTKSYAIEIFKQDGNIIFLPVKTSDDILANCKLADGRTVIDRTANGRTVNTFVIDGDLTGVCENDIYAFGIKDKIVEDCLIESKIISQSPELSAELFLIPYAPEVFDAPTKPVPPYDPKTTARNSYSIVVVEEKQQGKNPNNGASVQDDDGIFFDFGSYSVHGNKIVNRGSMRTLGDVLFKNVSFEVFGDKNYAVVNNESQVKLNVDTLLFKNSSVNFWIKDLSCEGYVFSYADQEGGNRYQMQYKKGNLVLTIQNVHITIPIVEQEESMITVVNNYSEGTLAVYIGTNCYAKHSTREAELGNYVNKDKKKMILKNLIVYGKVNRAIPFYLFADSNTTIEKAKVRSFCGKVAQFRVFGWALNEHDIADIYENKRLLMNTAAETRYIGEFVTAPEGLNLYDTFRYAGETNDTFLKDKKYALVQNGWQIWED